jgi:hypothetical protein
MLRTTPMPAALLWSATGTAPAVPWNLFVTIIADRRVQPLDDVLFCLWNSGYGVPAGTARAAVPPHALHLYEKPAQSHVALSYFPRPTHVSPPAP